MRIIKRVVPHVNSRIPTEELLTQINEKFNLEITKKQFDDVIDKYMVDEYGHYPALNTFIRNLLLDKNFFEMCDDDYKTTIREIFMNELTLHCLNTMVNNTIYEKYHSHAAMAEN